FLQVFDVCLDVGWSPGIDPCLSRDVLGHDSSTVKVSGRTGTCQCLYVDGSSPTRIGERNQLYLAGDAACLRQTHGADAILHGFTIIGSMVGPVITLKGPSV